MIVSKPLALIIISIVFIGCNRSIHVPSEEISAPLIKKGDLTASFSPVLSSFIYSNFSLAYSPIHKYGIGISSFNNNFYNKYTLSGGRYFSNLSKIDSQEYLYSGFLTEIYGHYSIGNVKNIETAFDFFGSAEETFDVYFKSYKIDFGFNYFYKYVQLTFRPKLTLMDINKVIVRIPQTIDAVNNLLDNDPYSFFESTYKISLGNARFGVYGGANILMGNAPEYFDRFNIFVGGRMNLTEILK